MKLGHEYSYSSGVAVRQPTRLREENQAEEAGRGAGAHGVTGLPVGGEAKAGRVEPVGRHTDVVVETVLAPADGPALIQDPPPKALTLRERKAVYRKLEAIEIEDKGLETK